MKMVSTAINSIRSYRRRRCEHRRSASRIAILEPLLPKFGVGAELGVFEGLFTCYLVDRLKPSKLHLIDPWFHLSNSWTWAAGNPSTVNAVVKILSKWRSEIERGAMQVHVDFDTQLLPHFENTYFDWVYIDSSHQYEETHEELRLLSSKMKPQGVIAGDDWQPDPTHRHHGVYRAVSEFAESSDFSIILSDERTAQWALKRM